MSWKQTIEERQELVLVTSSSNGTPHAIVVISLGLIDEKILVGACLMKKTLENIQNNNQILLIAKANKEYYRIKGVAEIYQSGKYFDLAYGKSNPPMPKSALTITVQEIFDFDKQTIVSAK